MTNDFLGFFVGLLVPLNLTQRARPAVGWPLNCQSDEEKTFFSAKVSQKTAKCD